MTVGQKIKTLRLQENWSQKRLADELGVSETTIRNYELGRGGVREKHLKKLAEIFGVDISVLNESNIETYNDVMQMLFSMEDEFGLTTSNIEHIHPDDVVLVFNKRVLQGYINSWHKKRSELEEGNRPKEELYAWELRFPLSLADEQENRIKEFREQSKDE